MKVPTVKYKVRIVCRDSSFLEGIIHIPQGLRVIDFFNDTKEDFLAVTEAKFANIGQIHSFKLYNQYKKKKDLVILNKESVKWVEKISEA